MNFPPVCKINASHLALIISVFLTDDVRQLHTAKQPPSNLKL